MITALNIDDPDLTESYWLGWIAYDNLPSAFKVSRQTIDTEAGTMSFVDVTRPENVDIAIVTCTSLGLTTYINNPYTGIYDGDVWRRFDTIPNSTYKVPSDQSRFINKFDVNTIDLGNTYIVVNMSIDDVTMCYTIITMSPSELYNRHFTRSLTSDNINFVRGTAVPSGLSFDIDDSMIDGSLQTITVSGHTIKFFAGAFGLSGYGRPFTPNNTGGNYYNPLPVVRLHDDSDHTFLIGGSRFFAVSTGWQGGGYRITPGTGAINNYDFYDAATATIVGGFVGTVSFNDILAISQGTTNNCGVIAATNGNYAVQGCADGRYAIVRRMYSWYEILTTLSYLMRYTTERTYVTNANKYYPAISDANEFLGYLLNGDTDYDDLRPWQISGTALDAESDEYKPSDKPPYIPDEGDEDEKIGDSIGFNVNVPGGTASGLYTMYALRQAHISNLGAALWTSFNTPNTNFWQNVQMAVGLYEEAGSFDLSTILNYITSIRIYPFALINLPGYVGAGTGNIRMGTGKIPLDLSSGGAGNVGIMGSYTGVIDAGSVTIPAHYGDFRDLEGVTMSVYLPYIGNVTLNPAEVTGQTLQLTYAVDLTSGSCVAYLLLSGNWGYYPIGVYSGTIGADIPLTASQGNRMFLRDLKNVLGLGSILGGSLSGVDATDGDALAGAIGSGLASGAAYMAKNVYQQGMGAALTPPTLGGGGANFAGFGAPQTAYVQIRRHLYAYTARTFPADQIGRRTYGIKVLGTLSGFTVCDAVDVSGIPAPAEIQTDIKKLLESGVYL